MTMEPNWSALCRDPLELILASLDTCSAIRASAACKLWQSIIASADFPSLHVRHQILRPWFFLFGINDLVPARSQGFAFDPDLGIWLRLSPLLPPPHNCPTLAASGGLAFALVGAAQSSLCYAPGLMRQAWRETAPMSHPRGGPGLLVGAINHGKMFVVAGGGSAAERSAVETFCTTSNTWQSCPPLPPQVSAAPPLTCATSGSNFYTYGVYSGSIACLDVEQRRWSAAHFLKPAGCVYAFLIACESTLALVGVCTDPCLKVWWVDPSTLAYKEVGRMPDTLFSLFHSGEEDDNKSMSAKCTRDGQTIYIYSDSKFRDYLACFCHIGPEGECDWGALPVLPAPVNRFDRVICGSSVVGIDSCLTNPNN